MFVSGAPKSSENIDNSDINDKEIDSNISESKSAEAQQHEKKSASSKSWNNESECKEMDIQVEYNNSWEQYVDRVVYIIKDCKFEKLVIVLKWYSHSL
ncbi:2689_t:CDS:2 [Dentiscutata heterogama]|uniref:2689_t:CDS:1 n=1 Tax=Dentiscutata heterogama TaxID=1316150 RepID=A0ACA9MV82_9GLOM|nr:2689_t:CDS:2 [Dentiscutata heterogama]